MPAAGGAGEIGGTVPDDPGLTDAQRALLMGLDALLLQVSPEAHVLVAKQIIALWSDEYSIFQSQLNVRVERWRRRQLRVAESWTDSTGACQHLMAMLDIPGTTPAQSKAPARRKRPRKLGIRPSSRRVARKPIGDNEVEQFMRLVDKEGISTVFDPGVHVIDDRLAIELPLIALEKRAVYHDVIWPRYERGEIGRPWSPHDLDPRIALAFDYALLIMWKEKKWTWVISDRYFKRLPWRHPCKVTPEGRPGWKMITGLLDQAHLIERRNGQTWRLTREVRGVVTDTLMPLWLAAGTPSH